MTRKILAALAATATLTFLSLGAVPAAQAATHATVVIHTGAHAPAYPTYQPVYQPVYQPGYRPGYRPHPEAVPRARPGHFWVAGHWQHRGPRAVWQPGHWERSRAAAHRPHYRAPHHNGHYSKPQASRRDRDGDGVPNRHDQRPNNPYRY